MPTQRQFEHLNLGTVGQVNDERVEHQFQSVFDEVVSAVTASHVARSGGKAKGTVTIKITLEGQDVKEHGNMPVNMTVQVHRSLPKSKVSQIALMPMTGEGGGTEYLMDVTPVVDNQVYLHQVGKSGQTD